MTDVEKWADRTRTPHDDSTIVTTCEDDSKSTSTLPSSPDVTPPACPDGRWRAWMAAGGAFLALFCTFGQLNSFGTFQTWYAEHQLRNLQPSTISWIGSLQLWVFFFSGWFIGRFFDVHGPRVIMIPGTIILAFSIMMVSLSTRYYQYILAQGILSGLGVGMIFYPSLAALATHFSKLRGTALGIAFAGSGVGGVVYPIMFQRLFAQLGFAWAVRVSGFVALACCVIAVCTITSLQPPKKRSGPWLQGKMFHDIPYVLVVIGSIFLSLGLFIPFFYIADYAKDQGISSSTAFYVLSALNGGSIVGRLAPGLVADVVGRFNVMVPCACLLGLSVVVFWIFAKTLVAIILFAILYGFLSGAFIALLIPCVAQISELKEIGTRIGVLYSIISFGALAGGPAAGAILKANHGSYNGMIALCGVANIIGSLFLLWSRLRIDRRLLIRI